MELVVKSTRTRNTDKRAALADASHKFQPIAFSPRSLASLPVIFRKAFCACGGGCPACLARSNDLKVSEPYDAAEIEADQIADRVMRMAVSEAKPAANTLNSPNTIHRTCDACEDEGATVQRKALPAGGGVLAQGPAHVQSAIGSGGRPLDLEARNFFEPRLGYDLSAIRIHTHSPAAQSARAIDAKAYTLGSNIVFGSGEYRPNSESGRSLLAHELAHVVQTTFMTSSGPEIVQRQPHSRSGSRTPPTPYITLVEVNQNTSQQVTATFSDGSRVGDECSTGKGHCCFDDAAGTAEGGACSAARSTQVGNNCTPVGNFTVTAKVPVTSGGVQFWTQFHDAKSVALHKYAPVDGTPLSHGCVRMHEKTAQAIFDGARVGVTRVSVTGLARPRCEDQTLQNEWSHDFASAGSTPPDGQTIDPLLGRRPTRAEIARERRHINETREEMRSAFGVDDAGLDAELARVQAVASIVSRIPRCVPALTTEEQRVSSAQTAGFLTSASSAMTTTFAAALSRARTERRAEQLVRQTGEQLWQNATALARAGGTGTDDRQLYWTRLMLTTALRQWNPSWVLNADMLRRLQTRLLSLLEQTSRGMTASAFPGGSPDMKRILISGFDPFGFPNATGDIRQSNLSEAATIALDGETLVQGATLARIEGVVFPVRYADFNEGIVENHLRSYLTGAQPPHLVMSISQGGTQFEFEEWAGRRRSAGNYLDNLGRPSGTETHPIEPPGLASGGREFLPHSVPPAMLGAMRGAEGRTSAIPEETTVRDLPPGATRPRDLPGGPGTSTNPAVEGSGGGFLSNEIFYRNSLLRTQMGSSVPIIHLHTPQLLPNATDIMRNNLITRIREILRATLPNL